MFSKRSFYSFFSSLAIVWSGFSFAATEPVAEPYELTILHINDHHSNLDDYQASLLLQTGKEQRESVSVSMGGFARVTAAIEKLAQKNRNTLTLHAGDAVTGTLYHTLFAGQADADLMNTVCFDAMVLGNHEFDSGDLALFNFTEMLWQHPTCKTPLLSANFIPGLPSPLQGKRIRPSVILERDGHKIGIIGVTTAYSTQNASRPDPGTVFDNELESVQSEIDRLTGLQVNKIILLSHIGYMADLQLAQQLSGVDVIVGGHSHTLLGSQHLSDYGLTASGRYPAQTNDASKQPVCIVQAWQYSAVVGELQVRFDSNGNVTHCNGQPHILIGHDFNRRGTPLNATELAAVQADLAGQKEIMQLEPSVKATHMLEPYQKKLADFASKPISTVTQELCSRRFPGILGASNSKLEGCSHQAHPNTHGGDIQQLVAHAFLMQGKHFGGADFAIQNGGGVRTDLANGPVTVGDIYTVLPFRNTLVRLTMKGSDIKKVLEEAIDSVLAGNTGSYPYAAALRWNVDLSAQKYERLSGLQMKNTEGSWVSFDPDATYQVIAIDFLADGKDGYHTFADISGEQREDTFLAYADAFLKFAQSQEELKRLPESEYSTQALTGSPSVGKMLNFLQQKP